MGIRVLLVDSHRIMLDALRALLTDEPDLHIVGQTTEGRMALQLVDQWRPHVVIIAHLVSGSNGVEVTRQIVGAYPDVKVIALSAWGDGAHRRAMLEAGAIRYLDKNSTDAETLRRTLETVCPRARYDGASAAGGMAREPADSSSTPRPRGQVQTHLSKRQEQVLRLVATGHSSKQIAARLGLSTQTVNVHRRNIARQLNLHGVAELTHYALHAGLVKP